MRAREPKAFPLMLAEPAALLAELFEPLLAGLGFSLGSWLRGWARVAPALVLVPIFGGSALPAPVRAALGAALALGIAPALRPASGAALPLPLELLQEVARGLPVAIGAAILIHTALMAGGAIDDLRGARETSQLSIFDDPHTPFGVVLGLLVAIGVLESGGAARLVAALAEPARAQGSLAVIAQQLSGAVGVAVAVAAPVAAATIVVSAAEALIARAASPAHVSALLSPLRSILVLAVAALALDRMAELLVATAAR
jgi:flagellar biosynthesis protein FliR